MRVDTNFVYTIFVKNITFSADEDLIERARSIAREQHRTLNDAFREWLAEFTSGAGDAQAFDSLMKRLRYVNTGRHFSRDEMNER
jgi:predicted transcriptional regulator